MNRFEQNEEKQGYNNEFKSDENVHSTTIFDANIDQKDIYEVSKANARFFIRKEFKDPTSLDDLENLRQEYQKKLASVEMQLSGLVHVKVEGIQKALDVVEETHDKMNGLKVDMEEMNKLCIDAQSISSDEQITSKHHPTATTQNINNSSPEKAKRIDINKKIEISTINSKVAFDSCPKLKKIGRAVVNISNVLNEIIYFANLGQRVDHLMEELQSLQSIGTTSSRNMVDNKERRKRKRPLTGDRLIEIYLESQQLEKWRDDLLYQKKQKDNIDVNIDTAMGEDLAKVKAFLELLRSTIIGVLLPDILRYATKEPNILKKGRIADILKKGLAIIQLHEEFQETKRNMVIKRVESKYRERIKSMKNKLLRSEHNQSNNTTDQTMEPVDDTNNISLALKLEEKDQISKTDFDKFIEIMGKEKPQEIENEIALLLIEEWKNDTEKILKQVAEQRAAEYFQSMYISEKEKEMDNLEKNNKTDELNDKDNIAHIEFTCKQVAVEYVMVDLLQKMDALCPFFVDPSSSDWNKERNSKSFIDSVKQNEGKKNFLIEQSSKEKRLMNGNVSLSGDTSSQTLNLNIASILRDSYEELVLKNKVRELYERGMDSLYTEDLLVLLILIDTYHEEVNKKFSFYSFKNEHLSKNTFSGASTEILSEYISRTKENLKNWFRNIYTREDEIRENSSRYLITSKPEDYFNILHLQFEVILTSFTSSITEKEETLKPGKMYHLITICLNFILHDFSNQVFQHLKYYRENELDGHDIFQCMENCGPTFNFIFDIIQVEYEKKSKSRRIRNSLTTNVGKVSNMKTDFRIFGGGKKSIIPLPTSPQNHSSPTQQIYTKFTIPIPMKIQSATESSKEQNQKKERWKKTINEYNLKESLTECSIESLIATVNDYDRFQNKMIEYFDEIRMKLNANAIQVSDSLKNCEAIMEAIRDRFVEIGLEANANVQGHILGNLFEKCQEILFTPQWCGEGGQLQESVFNIYIIPTLEDYFNDLKVWMDDYYFTTLVQNMVEYLLASYIYCLFKQRGHSMYIVDGKQKSKQDHFGETIISTTNPEYLGHIFTLNPFQNGKHVARNIKNDREAFIKFFRRYDDYLDDSIEKQCSILDLLCYICDPLLAITLDVPFHTNYVQQNSTTSTNQENFTLTEEEKRLCCNSIESGLGKVLGVSLLVLSYFLLSPSSSNDLKQSENEHQYFNSISLLSFSGQMKFVNTWELKHLFEQIHKTDKKTLVGNFIGKESSSSLNNHAIFTQDCDMVLECSKARQLYIDIQSIFESSIGQNNEEEEESIPKNYKNLAKFILG